MDRSLRDTVPNWMDFIQFAKSLSSNVHISDDMTHIGAIAFDQTAEVLLKFNALNERGHSLKAVEDQMDTWRVGSNADKEKPDTVIGKAMELARTDLFTHGDGARGYDEVWGYLIYSGCHFKPQSLSICCS